MRLEHIHEGLYKVTYDVLVLTKNKPFIDIAGDFHYADTDRYARFLNTSTPDAPIDVHIASTDYGIMHVGIGRWATRHRVKCNSTIVDPNAHDVSPVQRLLSYARGKPLYPVAVQIEFESGECLDGSSYMAILETHRIARLFSGYMYDGTRWTNRAFGKNKLLTLEADDISRRIGNAEKTRQEKTIEKWEKRERFTLL